MELGIKENQIASIGLHKYGKSAGEIFTLRLFKNSRKLHMYIDFNQLKELSSVSNKPGSG